MIKIKKSNPKRSTQKFWRDYWFDRRKQPAWFYHPNASPMRSARYEALNNVPVHDRDEYPLCRSPVLNYRYYRPTIFTMPYRCYLGQNINNDEADPWVNAGDQIVYNAGDAQFSGDGGFYINITGYTTVRVYPADSSPMRILKFMN